jgi:glucose-1-phosphate adenylyltransferase
VEKRSVLEGCIVLPSVTIGHDCKIRGAILAEGCQVPSGTAIGYDPESDHKKYCVSDKGILLVTPEMLTGTTVAVHSSVDNHLNKTWLASSSVAH